MTRSDEELLAAFAGGERDALGRLAERYERPLLASRERAVDAVQETWLRVVRHASKFNGRSSVKTWLYRIAINQCRTALASRTSPAGDSTNASADPAKEPAAQVAADDEAQRLKHAVERLSAPLRETILLCYTHGLTHPEAAEAMNVPIGTVKSRVHAALQKLRDDLGGEG